MMHGTMNLKLAKNMFDFVHECKETFNCSDDKLGKKI
jgi:hypothetical protein